MTASVQEKQSPSAAPRRSEPGSRPTAPEFVPSPMYHEDRDSGVALNDAQGYENGGSNHQEPLPPTEHELGLNSQTLDFSTLFPWHHPNSVYQGPKFFYVGNSGEFYCQTSPLDILHLGHRIDGELFLTRSGRSYLSRYTGGLVPASPPLGGITYNSAIVNSIIERVEARQLQRSRISNPNHERRVSPPPSANPPELPTLTNGTEDYEIEQPSIGAMNPTARGYGISRASTPLWEGKACMLRPEDLPPPPQPRASTPASSIRDRNSNGSNRTFDGDIVRNFLDGLPGTPTGYDPSTEIWDNTTPSAHPPVGVIGQMVQEQPFGPCVLCGARLRSRVTQRCKYCGGNPAGYGAVGDGRPVRGGAAGPAPGPAGPSDRVCRPLTMTMRTRMLTPTMPSLRRHSRYAEMFDYMVWRDPSCNEWTWYPVPPDAILQRDLEQ